MVSKAASVSSCRCEKQHYRGRYRVLWPRWFDSRL